MTSVSVFLPPSLPEAVVIKALSFRVNTGGLVEVRSGGLLSGEGGGFGGWEGAGGDAHSI